MINAYNKGPRELSYSPTAMQDQPTGRTEILNVCAPRNRTATYVKHMEQNRNRIAQLSLKTSFPLHRRLIEPPRKSEKKQQSQPTLSN